MNRIATILLVAAAALLAGCSDDSTTGPATAEKAPTLPDPATTQIYEEMTKKGD